MQGDYVRMHLVAVVALFKGIIIMQTFLELIGGIAGFVILWAFLYFLLSF